VRSRLRGNIYCRRRTALYVILTCVVRRAYVRNKSRRNKWVYRRQINHAREHNSVRITSAIADEITRQKHAKHAAPCSTAEHLVQKFENRFYRWPKRYLPVVGHPLSALRQRQSRLQLTAPCQPRSCNGVFTRCDRRGDAAIIARPIAATIAP